MADEILFFSAWYVCSLFKNSEEEDKAEEEAEEEEDNGFTINISMPMGFCKLGVVKQ